MKNKLFLLFVFLNFIVFSYEEYKTENEITIENSIKVNDTLVLKSKNKSEKYFWWVKEKPFLSKAKIIENSKEKIIFTPDVVGKYEIGVRLFDNTIVYSNFFAKKETLENLKDLYIDLKEYHLKKDFKITKKLAEEIYKNYPNSFEITEVLYKYSFALYNLKEIKQSKYILELMLNNYTLYGLEKEKILLLLSNIYKHNGNFDLAERTLTKLAKSNEYYLLDLAELVFENIEKDRGLLLLQKTINTKRKKEASKILGDYYFENNNLEKAKKYYILGDLLKLSKIYISNNENKNYYKLVDKLNEDEINNIEEYRKELKDKKEIKNKIIKQYEVADRNFKTGRYELAKLYYSRIINGTKDKKMVEKALLNLAEVYYLEKDYKSAIDYYSSYLAVNNNGKKPEILYYIGDIYYNIGSKTKSKEIFEKIVDEFPLTVFETKSKIYLEKLKNN